MAVVAVLLLCAAGLAVYAQMARPDRPTTAPQTAVESSSITSQSRGNITFSSPISGASLAVGQTLTISGSITPTPSLPDSVVIVAGQWDSTTAIPGVVVTVEPDGAFSYSTVVSPYWNDGAYVITVTDSNGATGIETFLVAPQS